MRYQFTNGLEMSSKFKGQRNIMLSLAATTRTSQHDGNKEVDTLLLVKAQRCILLLCKELYFSHIAFSVVWTPLENGEDTNLPTDIVSSHF